MRLTLRAALFAALAVGLAAIAWAAFPAGQVVIGLAAAALALWMGDLALRDAGLRRARGRRRGP